MLLLQDKTRKSKLIDENSATAGETALILACKKDNIEDKLYYLELLLKHGANPNIMDEDNFTPLWLFVQVSNMDGIKLLKKYNYNFNKYINIQDKSYQYTPFLLTCELGAFDILKYFIDLKLDIDLNLTNKSKQNALHIACNKNNEKMVRYLINELNFDPNLLNIGDDFAT